MVTKREYRCNLCHDFIAHRDSTGKEGFGIYWTSLDNRSTGWTLKPVNESENHLCAHCLASIADLKVCAHAIKGCGGGLKCTSDHK